MIGDQLVEFTDLQRLSGYERRADVEAWAKRIGLPTKPTRGGLCTTVEAINQALGVTARVDAELYGEDVL